MDKRTITANVNFCIKVIARIYSLKGTVSRDFRHLFYQKTTTDPKWTGKNGFVKFSFLRRYSQINVCPRSQQLRWHGVSIVNDYAQHDVSVVNDYADTVSA